MMAATLVSTCARECLLVSLFFLGGCLLDFDSLGPFPEDGGGGMGGSGTTSSMVSTGGDGGAGQTTSMMSSVGGGGASCESNQKICDDTCVAQNDPAYGCAPDTCSACPISQASCDAGTCTGPCGPVPKTGLQICWVYKALAVPGNQFVGLAGGLADPGAGQTIQTQFNDPRFVNSTAGQGFVLYDLGNAQPGWEIQFRAGLHTAPGNGTAPGTWDCSSSSCAGDVFIYQDGKEVGSLLSDVESGVVSTLPHFDPPYLLNVKVTL